MIRKLILSISFSILLFGGALKIEDKIGTFSLTNQFDKIEIIKADISTIIVSFDDKSLDIVTKFLAKKPDDFLKNTNSIFIANISCKPSVVTRMFTLPKLRDLKYDIMIINDEKNIKFSKQHEKITIYKISEGTIKSISYIDSIEALEEFF